jgi:hypothetical protein
MTMRRRELLRLIAAGGAAAFAARVLAKGDIPPGVAKLDGTAQVNGRPAQVGTPVKIGDRVTTGPSSQAVIVIDKDAFLLRSQTVIEFSTGNEGALSSMLISAGKVLSVFAKKPVAIKAATASIGIRGTGAYLEVDPDAVYFCLCYGEALVEGPRMSAKTVVTTHHEQPLLLTEANGILGAAPGPFRNHSDAELVMLESLVGREPPFMKDGTYPAKKY